MARILLITMVNELGAMWGKAIGSNLALTKVQIKLDNKNYAITILIK